MAPTDILYPSIAMTFLTLAILGYTALSRLRAVNRGEVSLGYYRLYDRGEEPPRLRQLTRHVQNHFEVPPLFHLVAVLLFVTGNVGALTVGLAWLYFASRCVHSYVHLGSNAVPYRFAAFASGVFVLALLWLVLLGSLISSAS